MNCKGLVHLEQLGHTIISRIINKVLIIVKLDTNAHSVFLLHYHLVLVVKYRRQVFDEEISFRVREIFEHIAPNYKITLLEWNHDKDHIHILFKAHPKTEISKFINAYKSASSRLLKKEFTEIRKNFGKNIFGVRAFVSLLRVAHRYLS